MPVFSYFKANKVSSHEYQILQALIKKGLQETNNKTAECTRTAVENMTFEHIGQLNINIYINDGGGKISKTDAEFDIDDDKA